MSLMKRKVIWMPSQEKTAWDRHGEYLLLNTHKHQHKEYWWNISIKTSNKCKYNRVDIVFWDRQKNVCTFKEVSYFVDLNILSKIKGEEDNSGQLIRNFQLLYADYQFTTLPLIIGVLGFESKCLGENSVFVWLHYEI